MQLAPFSELAHTSRARAIAHRQEVHQRLGVLTPEVQWFWEGRAPATAAQLDLMDDRLSVIPARLEVVCDRATPRPSFAERIQARRYAAAEARSVAD